MDFFAGVSFVLLLWKWITAILSTYTGRSRVAADDITRQDSSRTVNVICGQPLRPPSALQCKYHWHTTLLKGMSLCKVHSTSPTFPFLHETVRSFCMVDSFVLSLARALSLLIKRTSSSNCTLILLQTFHYYFYGDCTLLYSALLAGDQLYKATPRILPQFDIAFSLSLSFPSLSPLSTPSKFSSASLALFYFSLPSFSK